MYCSPCRVRSTQSESGDCASMTARRRERAFFRDDCLLVCCSWRDGCFPSAGRGCRWNVCDGPTTTIETATTTDARTEIGTSKTYPLMTASSLLSWPIVRASFLVPISLHLYRHHRTASIVLHLGDLSIMRIDSSSSSNLAY